MTSVFVAMTSAVPALVAAALFKKSKHVFVFLHFHEAKIYL
jgi:hypothetical protein